MKYDNSPIHNKYPLMTTLIINNIEYLATISHEGTQFELIDFIQENTYTCGSYKVLAYNSFILKNTFTNLNYYKNSDYVLNAYIDKHGSNFLIQKLNYRHYNISKYQILANEKK